MTEKRFTRSNTYGWNKDGFLNTMNGLNEKNETLKKENEELKKENEELKKENQSWLKTTSYLHTVAHKDRDYAKRMHKENEQLKQFIQELTTKGTGRIDLADGYSYKVNAILTDFKW